MMPHLRGGQGKRNVGEEGFGGGDEVPGVGRRGGWKREKGEKFGKRGGRKILCAQARTTVRREITHTSISVLPKPFIMFFALYLQFYDFSKLPVRGQLHPISPMMPHLMPVLPIPSIMSFRILFAMSSIFKVLVSGLDFST